jgi:hypothetical protein
MKLPTGQIYAKAMLDELGIVGLVDVREVASQLRLELNEVEVDGFDGALIRAEGVSFGAIAVRRGILEEGRKNFTIAHEIGHYVLPGHEKCDEVCLDTDVGNWSDGGKQLEREADEFAAELLIPTSYARPRFSETPPSLQTISAVATDCRASLLATAWRYCDLAPYACAIVWSKESRIAWSRASGEFDFFIEWGKYLEKGTFARALFEGGKTEGDSPNPVPAGLWLDSRRLHEGAEIWEQSVFLRNYRSVLSLLWIKEPISTENETNDLLPELDPFGLDSVKRRR